MNNRGDRPGWGPIHFFLNRALLRLNAALNIYLLIIREMLINGCKNSHSWFMVHGPRVGPGHPSSPCPFTSSSFPLFYFSLSFIGFTYFLLLSIPSLSTGIVPLRFQAGGRRRRPNLVLVCFLFCTLCYLYSLVKMYCGALFYLV